MAERTFTVPAGNMMVMTAPAHASYMQRLDIVSGRDPTVHFVGQGENAIMFIKGSSSAIDGDTSYELDASDEDKTFIFNFYFQDPSTGEWKAAVRTRDPVVTQNGPATTCIYVSEDANDNDDNDTFFVLTYFPPPPNDTINAFFTIDAVLKDVAGTKGADLVLASGSSADNYTSFHNKTFYSASPSMGSFDLQSLPRGCQDLTIDVGSVLWQQAKGLISEDLETGIAYKYYAIYIEHHGCRHPHYPDAKMITAGGFWSWSRPTGICTVHWNRLKLFGLDRKVIKITN